LIGVNCSQTHIVSVVVRPLAGSEGRPRSVDLISSRYLRDGAVKCVCVQPHENAWCIRLFCDPGPDQAQLEFEPFFLTIFVNPQVRTSCVCKLRGWLTCRSSAHPGRRAHPL
jgi:hypothetical protein